MFSFLSDLLRWFGQGLLTRPSSSTDGLSVPDRWRVTWRPRSAEGRLFVDHYLGGSLGSAVEAARCGATPKLTPLTTLRLTPSWTLVKEGIWTTSTPIWLTCLTRRRAKRMYQMSTCDRRRRTPGCWNRMSWIGS